MQRSEVVDEFRTVQNIQGLGLIKEDMGFHHSDGVLLTMDDGNYTEEELALLNLEVTPEIEEILNKALFAKALEDVTKWAAQRAEVYQPVDYVRVLEALVETQEDMAKAMKDIQATTRTRNEALVALDIWVKRYNTWRTSDVYQKYPYKSQAAKIFFNGLADRKEAYQENKSRLQGLWDKWNDLKAESDRIVGSDSFLWNWYFNLAEEEINPYFTNGDVEDVDDFRLLANTQKEVSDILEETHYREQVDFEQPESEKLGFWNFREEYKAERRYVRDAEEDAYLASFDTMMNAA